MRGDMAIQVTQTLICDVCGSPEGVTRYRITRDGKTVSPDLCVEHGDMIEGLFKKMPTGQRGRSRARPVVSEAEIVKRRVKKK